MLRCDRVQEMIQSVVRKRGNSGRRNWKNEGGSTTEISKNDQAHNEIRQSNARIRNITWETWRE